MSQEEMNFFNTMAEQWDQYRVTDQKKLTGLVQKIGLNAGDNVLDIGCGTGVLLPYVKQEIGETGKITAVDFATQMVACAAQKYSRLAGISYVVSDIMEFAPQSRFDKAVCLNFFPHAKDKAALVLRIKELLVPGGSLTIMHDISRAKVNAIHGSNGAVSNDRLPAIEKVTAMLFQTGYQIEIAEENDEMYFIKASKA